MSKKTIGELIEQEVRKQGISITSFADQIYCTRANVYDIFKRSKMDVAQLALVSRVLNRNFFQELAEDPELVNLNNPDVEKDLLNRRAIAQFFDVVPRVFKKLGIKTCIVLQVYDNVYNDPLPDYGLSDYAVFFTVGERLRYRFNDENIGCFDVKTLTSPEGHQVDFWINKLNMQASVDIKLDYKSENEWEEVFSFVQKECFQYITLPRF